MYLESGGGRGGSTTLSVEAVELSVAGSVPPTKLNSSRDIPKQSARGQRLLKELLWLGRQPLLLFVERPNVANIWRVERGQRRVGLEADDRGVGSKCVSIL